MLRVLTEMDALLRIWISYYDPRTLSSGSGEPLLLAKPPRNVPRTGWGPRGDSGPERDRVRATQPANLKISPLFPLPYAGLPPLHSSDTSECFLGLAGCFGASHKLLCKTKFKGCKSWTYGDLVSGQPLTGKTKEQF